MTTFAHLTTGAGEQWQQVGELLLAFVLASVIGLERQFRGKSAGIRTQAIVGTASALFLLIGKYGFSDVVAPGTVGLDPSRVAASIVTGVGFLGAGLIITRRGAIRGLTTAASVWETSAIGMAAAAGLPLLALAVTALHFVVVLGFTPLTRLVAARGTAERDVTVTYEDGRGVLRELLSTCSARAWTIRSLSVVTPNESDRADRRVVMVSLRLSGRGVDTSTGVLGGVTGVVGVDAGDEEDE